MRVATLSRNARSCVMTMAAGALEQQVLEQRDAVDVEVVGRLVEQQQLRLQRERERQRRPLALAARGGVGRDILREPEPMQELDEAGLGTPALALVRDLLESTSQREALAQRGRLRQLGLLLDERDG